MAAKMWHKLFTTKSKKNRTTPSTATTTNKKSTFSNVIKSLSLSTSKVNCSDADKKIAGTFLTYFSWFVPFEHDAQQRIDFESFIRDVSLVFFLRSYNEINTIKVLYI